MTRIYKSHKWLYLTAIVLVVSAIAYYLLVIRPNQTTQQPASQTNTKTTTNGDKQPAGSSSTNQGTATDNKGQTTTPVTTSPSQWQHSQSGLLTVQQPIANATVTTGFTLSGTDSVDNVHFRLIDNKSGVISQGVITLVNGNFSANINFKSSSSTGRLDVFNTDAMGKEINEVQIAVSFGA